MKYQPNNGCKFYIGSREISIREANIMDAIAEYYDRPPDHLKGSEFNQVNEIREIYDSLCRKGIHSFDQRHWIVSNDNDSQLRVNFTL